MFSCQQSPPPSYKSTTSIPLTCVRAFDAGIVSIEVMDERCSVFSKVDGSELAASHVTNLGEQSW